jgi:hypothetical protein
MAGLARAGRPGRHPDGRGGWEAAGVHIAMATLLWIIAVVLVIAGVVALLRRQLVFGIVLIIVGLLVGPGGVSIFT